MESPKLLPVDKEPSKKDLKRTTSERVVIKNTHAPLVASRSAHVRPKPSEIKNEAPSAASKKIYTKEEFERELQQTLKKYKMKEYLESLQRINKKCFLSKNKNPAELWKEEIGRYLTEIFDDVLTQHGIKPGDYTYALCICGSLAKKQATPYSDLDCFIVTKDEATTKALQPVVKDLDFIFYDIFEKTNQLCMDPIGINPQKFIGDPETLAQKISSGKVADSDSFFNSVMSADYVYGHGTGYLEAFREKLKEAYKDRQEPTPIALAERYYKQATENFKGPDSKKEIDLKSDLFRPLDFILLGLRMEAELDSKDNEANLNAVAQVKELRKKGKVSDEIVYLVSEIYEKAMKLRFNAHVKAQKEHDHKSLVPTVPTKSDSSSNEEKIASSPKAKEEESKSDSSLKAEQISNPKEESKSNPSLKEEQILNPKEESKSNPSLKEEQILNLNEESKSNLSSKGELIFPKSMEVEHEEPVTKEEVKELRSLIDAVAILRGIANKRLALIKKGVAADDLPPFSIGDFLNPDFDDKIFSSREIVWDPIPLLDKLSNQHPERQADYSRIANSWGHRKEFIRLVDEIEIKANGQNSPLKDELLKLVSFLKQIPIIASQIVKYGEFAHALLDLIDNQNIDNIFKYEKLLAIMRSMLPNIPYVNIANIIKINQHLMLTVQQMQTLDVGKHVAIEELQKIKYRCDHLYKTPGHYDNLLQIMIRFKPGAKDENQPKNTGIAIKKQLDLINVVKGLNHLETYNKSFPVKRFNFSHSKQSNFIGYMQEMEQRLAVNGKQDAVSYLFEIYHRSLAREPKSAETKILGEALAITLGIKSAKLNPYQLYGKIIENISYPQDLKNVMESYKDKKTKSLSYKIFSSTRNKIDASLKIITDASNALSKHGRIEDFNFSAEAFHAFEKNPLCKVQLQSLLLDELAIRGQELRDNYEHHHTRTTDLVLPNLKRAIDSIDRVLRIIAKYPMPNENFPLLFKALKLAADITAMHDPYSEAGKERREELEKLLPQLKQNSHLKWAVRYLKVFLNVQHPKQKLLDKLQRKIDEWHHSSYKAKREALEKLRDEIKATDDNETTFKDLMEDKWNNIEVEYKGQTITYKDLIHTRRFPSFFAKDDDKTETEEFLETLQKKYGDVTLKK